MAKLFVFLLGVLVILNGLTFLLVVNQGSFPEKSEAAAATSTAKPGASGPEGHRMESRLDRIESLVQNVNKSVGDLTRKLDDLQRKVVATGGSRVPVANFQAPAAPGAAGAARLSGAPPAARTGPVDYSRLPNPPSTSKRGAVAATEEEEEPAGDDAASHPSKTLPGASTASGNPASGTNQAGADSPTPAGTSTENGAGGAEGANATEKQSGAAGNNPEGNGE